MRTIFIILLSVFVLIFTTSAQKESSHKSQQVPTFEVPFTMDRNLILIDGKLNGEHSYKFIFDTGTNGLVICDSIAQQQHLKTKGQALMVSPNGDTLGKANIVSVSKLNINGLVLKKSSAVVCRNEEIFSPQAVGIVGLSAFNGYVVTIDYANAKLIFKKGALALSENVLSLDDSEILETEILLNGKKVRAHFDCGSPSYIAIPKEWEYQLKTEPVLIGKARVPGSEFEIYSAQLDGELVIGKSHYKDPQIELMTGGFPAINIGFAFFKKHLISIDLKNKRMEIQAN